MKLTISTSDGALHHIGEVSPDMSIGDIKALVEADLDVPREQQDLVWSGQVLRAENRTLREFGISGESEVVLLRKKTSQPVPGRSEILDSTMSAATGTSFATPNSSIRSTSSMYPGNLARFFGGGIPNAASLPNARAATDASDTASQSSVAPSGMSTIDVDDQRMIYEKIRQENVNQNYLAALEYHPESFGAVHMLYVPIEINSHPCKAFVDSGAQATIISPEFAQKCGLLHLVDTRFSGVAMGVGTAKIIGRIHAAQLKIGTQHLMCSFTVVEGQGNNPTNSVDLLFGLDMLKRHQIVIDLTSDCLRIGDEQVPFLPEHQLPNRMRLTEEQAQQLEFERASQSGSSTMGSAATRSTAFTGAGQTLGQAPGVGRGRPKIPESLTRSSAAVSHAPGTGSRPSQGSDEAKVAQLMAIDSGITREVALNALAAAGGNVEVAAGLLFHGG